MLLPTTGRGFGWQQSLDFGLKILDLGARDTNVPNLKSPEFKNFLFSNISDKEYSAQSCLENFMTPPQGTTALVLLRGKLGPAQSERGSPNIDPLRSWL